MTTTERPRIGLLGIMQELYDAMIPRITEHQAAFAAELVQRCAPVAELHFSRPARDQANALLRAGLPYAVITEDWRSPEFLTAFRDWALAARTVTRLKQTKIVLF